jgi:hypothetical protein
MTLAGQLDRGARASCTARARAGWAAWGAAGHSGGACAAAFGSPI